LRVKGGEALSVTSSPSRLVLTGAWEGGLTLLSLVPSHQASSAGREGGREGGME